MTSTVLTIRASRTLESAQQAWSKILNLPGNAPQASRPASQNPTSRSRSRIRAAYANRSIDEEPVRRIYPAPKSSRGNPHTRSRIEEIEEPQNGVKEYSAKNNRRVGRHYRPDSLPGPYRHPGLPNAVAEQQHHRQHGSVASGPIGSQQQASKGRNPGNRRVRFDV
jgi:hypothetical protein